MGLYITGIMLSFLQLETNDWISNFNELDQRLLDYIHLTAEQNYNSKLNSTIEISLLTKLENYLIFVSF